MDHDEKRRTFDTMIDHHVEPHCSTRDRVIQRRFDAHLVYKRDKLRERRKMESDRMTTKLVSPAGARAIRRIAVERRRVAAAFMLALAVVCCWKYSSTPFKAPLTEHAVAETLGTAADRPRLGYSESGVPLGSRSIESMDVGQWVLAENPTGEQDLEFGLEIEPRTWRLLELRAPKVDGSYADVRMLRPLWWLQEQAFPPAIEIVVGDGELILVEQSRFENEESPFDPEILVDQTVFISVPECGIDGDAEVLSVGACPQISPRPGPEFEVVTATFRHQAAQVLDVYIDGMDAAIGTTRNHPFWSEDRTTFVRADELVIGEHLRQADGSLTTVAAVMSRPGRHTVYNLEVQVDHVYHVGSNGALVHNGTPQDCFRWVQRMRHQLGGNPILIRPRPGATNIGRLPGYPNRLPSSTGRAIPGGWPQHGAILRNGKIFDSAHPAGIAVRQWFEQYRVLNGFSSLREVRQWLTITRLKPGFRG